MQTVDHSPIFALICSFPFPPTQGAYDNETGFNDLNKKMSDQEGLTGMPRANRMFFLSIPPNVFIAAAGGAADYCSSP